MKQAYVFPGQGSQFTGMGKNLYDASPKAKLLFEQANTIAGFDLAEIMFSGSDEQLKQTNVTQPAIFLHSVIAFQSIEHTTPTMVAGHSLGEFSALVANGVLSFQDALKLVIVRANAMQEACLKNPSAMAAVLALSDEKAEEICSRIMEETGEVVVPANYNCPGQLVISGSIKGIDIACIQMKEAGAKRALVLPVGGAFHSPLMASAKAELAKAIAAITFNMPECPIYQNVVAKAVTEPAEIQKNLVDQLTGAVRWSQSVQAMIADGATDFVEVGPGKVLQGLIAKISKEVSTSGIS